MVSGVKNLQIRGDSFGLQLKFSYFCNIMNTITYKGYLGSVASSEEDDVFFGKIEGINGLVRSALPLR